MIPWVKLKKTNEKRIVHLISFYLRLWKPSFSNFSDFLFLQATLFLKSEKFSLAFNFFFHLLIEKHTNLWSELFLYYVSIEKCSLTGTKYKLFLKYFFLKIISVLLSKATDLISRLYPKHEVHIHHDTSNFYNVSNQK